MSSRWTWHGGGLEAARARFGEGAEPWLDLSTGINPRPWPGAERMTIDWHRLPEPEALAALEQAAADHFGVPADRVCALPGTEIGLRLVGRLLGGRIYAVRPSYGTHHQIANAVIDRDSIDHADGASLVLANPNNPDGYVFARDALLDLAERRGDGWLLPDEAFVDCDPALSVAGEVTDDRRLAVFRSFGKFFGLAGVRLGFLIAPSALLAPVREMLGAWPVSAAAIAIGGVAYRDAAWIEKTRRDLTEAAAALDAALTRAGYRATGACPLFRLIETEDAPGLFEHLARRAILSRPFSEQPRWLRLGLPADAAALSRLEAALRDG